MERMTPAQWKQVLIRAFLLATVLGWISVGWVYVGMNAFGRTYPFGRAVLAGLPDWYCWALVSPLVYWLGQVFRFERGRWPLTLGTHILAGTAISLTELAVVTLFHWSIGITNVQGPFGDVYLRAVLQYFHFNFIIYCVIVAAAHATRYYRGWRERELEAAQLRAALTQAQLTALQMQLQPHFLFNALHAVGALVRDRKTEEATDTLARLGSLLRRTLSGGGQLEVPLADELSMVGEYLGIEQARFSDRLDVSVDADPDTLCALVPPMVLQPLAENAIRHGIAIDPDARRVTIRARRSGNRLLLEVYNEGPAWRNGDSATNGNGVGLVNVRERLGHMYGAAHRFEIGAGTPAGTLATMEIPWRVTAA